MNDPLSSHAGQRAIDLLDRCVARMRRGLALERAGSDAPDEALELAPLLILADGLARWGARPIPAPPAELAPGRVRFLDAAARLSGSEALAAYDATADRLDAAVAQLAAGRSPDEALAHLNGDRDALRPLVLLAEQIRGEVVDTAPAPHGLQRGRAALFAAATELREAREAIADLPAPVLTALDLALERRWRGADPKTGLEPSLAAQLLPLVTAAADLRQRMPAAPMPPGGLAAGRERLLAHADALRRLAPARLSAKSRLDGSSEGGWWHRFFGGTLRLCASAAAALALFFGGTRALETSASRALPGDLLYPVKRANEGLDLMLVAFDKDELGKLRAQQAGRRVQEIVALAAAGQRSEQVLTGSFLSLDTLSADGEEGHGILRLRVPAEGDPATVLEIAWNGESRFGPGESSDPQALAPGQTLRLRLRTDSGGGLPLLVSLEAVGPPPPTVAALPPRPTVAASSTPDRHSPTPLRPLSSRTPAYTARPPASVTPPAGSATTVPEPVVTGQAPVAAATADRRISRVEGLLIGKPDAAAQWTLREFNGSAAVEIDVSEIDAATRDAMGIGDAVRVSYRRGTAPRRAVRIDLLQAQACPLQTAVGGLRSFDGDLLVLEDGRSFQVSRTVRIVGDLRPGAEISLGYRDCGSGPRVESIEASARNNVVSTGRIAGIFPDTDGILIDLETDDGIRRVLANDQTKVGGRGVDHLSGLAQGMLVRVLGPEAKDGVIQAQRIEVLALVDASSPTPPAAPTATPTSVPPTPAPTTGVEPLPLPISPLPSR